MNALRWLALLGMIWALSSPVALAVEFTVNDTNDTLDDNPGDGICADSSGKCTLRAALEEANALAGADTIQLSPVNYELTLGIELNIDTEVSLIGNGAFIDGKNATRVFYINTISPVYIENLVIANGEAGAGPGGGILAMDADLELLGVVFENNHADIGAGMDYFAGTRAPVVNLNHCWFKSNGAATLGGGLNVGAYQGFTLVMGIFSTTFEQNAAVTGGGLRVENVDGGGGFGTTDILLENVTVSNNTAIDDGGGLAFATENILADLEHVTIVENHADFNSDFTGNGGGLFIHPSATVRLKNSILAKNLLGGGAIGPDCFGILRSQDYNVIGDPADCDIQDTFLNNLTGAAASPLDLQGIAQVDGASLHAIGNTSVAKDLIPNGVNGCGSLHIYDQRVSQRPAPANDGCDAGAYEIFVNTAPTLDITKDASGAIADIVLTPVTEDTGLPSGSVGTLISAIVALGQNVTDPDDTTFTDIGIAVISADETNGTWHYSTDNGGAWSPIGPVGGTNAKLLAADAGTRIQFAPNANFQGTATIGFRAWDQTEGSNGSLINPTPLVSTRAFSVSSNDTATLTVTNVNDPPSIAQGGALGVSMDEDGAPTAFVASVDASDPDGDTLTWSITTAAMSGIATGSGTGTTFGALNYTPDANFNGSDSFVMQVSDGNGGTDSITITVTVNPVNDPPSISAVNPPVVIQDSGAVSVPGWATFEPGGGADESGQTPLAYSVGGVSNPGLFTVLPALGSTGTLTYTVAAGVSGASTFDVITQDNGGTANGGIDTSAAQTFTITVTPSVAPVSHAVTIVGGEGFGAVQGGLDCRAQAGALSGTCTQTVTAGSVITLQAVADPFMAFDAWSGDCAGQGASFDWTVDAATTCEVKFALDRDQNQIPDYRQSNFATQGGVTVIATGCPTCVLSGLTLTDPVSHVQPDTTHDFMTALVGFTLDGVAPGASVEFMAHFDSALDPVNWVYRKFAQTTPGDPSTTAWITHPATFSTLNLFGTPVVAAAFTLTDGAPGDNGGVDGILVDPGAPALAKPLVNDGSLTVTPTEVSLDEGGVASFILTRSGDGQGALAVTYATEDVTTQAADYQPLNGTLTWADGETGARTLTVSIVADASGEPLETLNLVLGGALNTVLPIHINAHGASIPPQGGSVEPVDSTPPTDAGLDEEVIPSLGAEDIAALPPTAFAAITPETWSRLEPGQLTGVSAEQFANLTPEVLASMTPAQFNALPIAAVAGLPAESLSALPDAVVAEINHQHLAGWPDQSLAALPPEQVSRFLVHLRRENVALDAIARILPPDYEYDPDSGDFLPPPGSAILLRALEVPPREGITLRLAVDLAGNLSVGGNSASPTLEQMIRAMLRRENLADQFSAGQGEDGGLGLQGTLEVGGIGFVFTPGLEDARRGENATPGIQLDGAGFYHLILDNGLRLRVTPAPRDFSALKEASGASELVQGRYGEVLLNFDESQRRRGRARAVGAFSPVVEPPPGEYCVEVAPGQRRCDFTNAPAQQRPGIHLAPTRRVEESRQTARVVYADGASQTVYPTLLEPDTFRRALIEAFPAIHAVQYQADGTLLALYDAQPFLLLPEFSVDSAAEGPARVTLVADRLQYRLPWRDSAEAEGETLIFTIAFRALPPEACALTQDEIRCDAAVLP